MRFHKNQSCTNDAVVNVALRCPNLTSLVINRSGGLTANGLLIGCLEGVRLCAGGVRGWGWGLCLGRAMRSAHVPTNQR